jgi:hypothetical protein
MDNIPDLWTQFLEEFRQQFQNTQKEDRAHTQLEGLRMCFPEIDSYIAKFKELARQAGYTVGNSETMHMFIKGLMPSVMEDVLKPPHAQGYHTIKQKVIECTQLRVLLDNILYLRQGNPEEEGSKEMPLGGSSKEPNDNCSFQDRVCRASKGHHQDTHCQMRHHG